MLAGRLPSMTAMIVACARGIDGAPDDIAHRLVPRPIARAMDLAMRIAPTGLAEHVAARTRTIDAAVLEHRAPQLVILGAGLDSRAHRLPQLSDVAVFEVDHPSTQAYKRRRAARFDVVARSLRYVAVDFEKADLAACLAGAGHEASVPTTWIWEGVTMYLTREAVRATLATVASLSAAESTLIVTYGTPELAQGSRALSMLRPLIRPAFAVLGEPLRFLPTSDEIAALVEREGFRAERDLAPGGHVAERVLVVRRTTS